jgi:hypothetical protein
MSWLSLTLYALAGLASALWALFYIWAHGLACAFGSPGGNCRIKMPWSLRGEDLIYLVLLPLTVVLLLLLLAWLAGRATRH